MGSRGQKGRYDGQTSGWRQRGGGKVRGGKSQAHGMRFCSVVGEEESEGAIDVEKIWRRRRVVYLVAPLGKRDVSNASGAEGVGLHSASAGVHSLFAAARQPDGKSGSWPQQAAGRTRRSARAFLSSFLFLGFVVDV